MKFLDSIQNMLTIDSFRLKNVSSRILDRIDQFRELLRPYQDKLISYLNRPVPGGVTGSTLVRLGTLFHEVGIGDRLGSDPDQKPALTWDDLSGYKATADALRHLRLSSQVIHHVSSCVAGHMRPALLLDETPISDRMIYRFFHSSGLAGIDILLVAVVHWLAAFGESSEKQSWHHLLIVVDQLLDGYFNRYDIVVRPNLLINGNTLMENLNMEPGPEVGRILEIVEEAQAAGEISSIEKALALARKEIGR